MDVLDVFQDSLDMVWISYILNSQGAWREKSEADQAEVIPQVIKLATLIMATDGMKASFIFACTVISLSQFK